jgi:hypothetical protein
VGSKQYSTGFGYQLHLVFAQNDRRFWFFYVDDSPGVLKTLASTDLVHWTAGTAIALPSGYSLQDGNNFSVAYANVAKQDVIHIVVNAITSSQETQAFHLRATITAGDLTASLPVAHPDSDNGGGACFQDGPATVIASDGLVYDVTAWTIHAAESTSCDTNIYLSPGTETGTSFGDGGAFTHDGYYVSVPSLAFSHDVVSLPEAGVVLVAYPDEDNSGTYDFDSIGWALSTAFDAGMGAPNTTGVVEPATSELFNGTGATAEYDDWSVCRVTDTSIHVVSHVASTTTTVSGFQELVYDGTTWQPSGIPPAAVTSGKNTGVALVADGNPADGVLAVTVGTDNTLYIAKSTLVGTWSTVATIPGSVQRQSLGGSGCGSAPAVIFWTEGVPDAGTPFVIMRADLTSLLGP